MEDSLGKTYLESVIKRLMTYKIMGEMTFSQLSEKDFFFTPGPQSNSIAAIIQHMSGNMISRWTNFLTEDGEKAGRNREQEFTPDEQAGTAPLMEMWNKGWSCLLDTLHSLTADDLLRTIYIRHEPLSAIDAINRQLAHYPHHVGQIVYIGKMLKGDSWESLSIPKGGSAAFNKMMEQKHK